MFNPHTNRPNNPISIGSDSDGYSDSELSEMEVDPPSRPQRAGMSSKLPSYMAKWRDCFPFAADSIHVSHLQEQSQAMLSRK